MPRLKILGGACAAALSLPAGAVPYALPDGAYAQLQTIDTYETVCQSGSPCDVPPGTYTLLTFGETVVRETVEVRGPSPSDGPSGPAGATPRLETVRDRSVYARPDPQGNYSVAASCPADTALVGVTTCRATRFDAGLRFPAPSDFHTENGRVTCAASSPFQTDFGSVIEQLEVEIELRCLALR